MVRNAGGNYGSFGQLQCVERVHQYIWSICTGLFSVTLSTNITLDKKQVYGASLKSKFTVKLETFYEARQFPVSYVWVIIYTVCIPPGLWPDTAAEGLQTEALLHSSMVQSPSRFSYPFVLALLPLCQNVEDHLKTCYAVLLKYLFTQLWINSNILRDMWRANIKICRSIGHVLWSKLNIFLGTVFDVWILQCVM